MSFIIFNNLLLKCNEVFSRSSAGKESTYNAGDCSLIPESEHSPGEGIGLPTPAFLGFFGGSYGEKSTCNVGGLVSIPGLGRSPGGGHVNPFQYFCLEIPRGQRSLAGYGPWGRKESDTTK